MGFPPDICQRLDERFHASAWVGMGCALASGGTVSTFCCGLADMGRGLAVQNDSLFNIASVGKLFTTVAILKLIETDQLTMETALGDLVEDLPSGWRRVRISHLLTHSSGIRNYTDTLPYWKEVQTDVPRERIVDYVKAYPLGFEPGSRWAYSNTGFFLLGLVTEAVSGTGYFDFIRQLIDRYKPGLRIEATRTGESVPGAVTGYEILAGEPVKAGYYSDQGTFSAGGFSASLPDFLDFENALFRGQILQEQSLAFISQAFLKPDGKPLRSSDPDFGFEMTHGLFKFRRSGLTFLTHRGETRGFTTSYKRILEKEVAVIISINSSDIEAIDQLTDEILEITLL